MSSYRQHLYHIVFRTKDSLPTIRQDHVNELYSYITGIIKHKNSHLYRINGVENHLHILTDCWQTVLCSENNMIKMLTIARHNVNILILIIQQDTAKLLQFPIISNNIKPFQGLQSVGWLHPGLHPGLFIFSHFVAQN